MFHFFYIFVLQLKDLIVYTPLTYSNDFLLSSLYLKVPPLPSMYYRESYYTYIFTIILINDIMLQGLGSLILQFHTVDDLVSCSMYESWIHPNCVIMLIIFCGFCP
jgi:hypothetical protein